METINTEVMVTSLFENGFYRDSFKESIITR